MFMIMTFSTIFCKLASLFLRIFLSRVAGQETLGMYLMILPTIGLQINMTHAGVPSALFTLSSNPRYNHQQLLRTAFRLCSTQFIICVIITHLFKFYFVSIYNYLPIIFCFIFVATINALLRSYYLGNEQGHIPAISQIIEECIRILTLFIIYFINRNLTLQNTLMGMLYGEIFAGLFLLINAKLKLFTHQNKSYLYKEFLSISLPMSITQLLNSFCRSLEPMIYQSTLLKVGYSTQTITASYGILNGCVFSLLMIPTFLNSVFYRILLPKISKSLSNKKRTQALLIKSIMGCILIGLPFSFVFFFFSKQSLLLLFHSIDGHGYLKYLSIPFLIYYIQTPLQAYLQAARKQKQLLAISIIQTITSLTILIIFLPILGPAALAYSFLCTLIINSILSFTLVYYYLFLHNE